MRLPINRADAEQALHALALTYGVTDAQMADYLFRNFYVASSHLRISQKIHRLSVTITNLSNTL